MTDVLFGQTYFLHFDPKLYQAMQPYPPLGTLFAAALTRRAGYDVALFDAMLAVSEAEWQAKLTACQPRFAVLFEDNFNYLSKMCLLRMRAAADTMIGMAKRAGTVVIVSGADASDHAEHYLKAGADYVLVGEGDATLVELLDCLTGRTSGEAGAIAGLAMLDGGVGVFTPRRVEIKDLDALPFPAWDLVDVGRYRKIWRDRHGYFSMNMVTTRGCPFHCNWCAKPIWGQRYHARSPENVAAEMAWLAKEYAPDHIWFADDIFGLKPGWLPAFADRLDAHGVRIPFKCLSRADLLLREGEAAALARAGCKTVWLGAESGSQKILDAMDKGTQVEQIRAARSALKEQSIEAGFFLQFGYPGEKRADVEATLQLVRDCEPDDIGISVSYPLPGTKFHAAVKHQLGAKQNWQDSNDLAMMYRGPFTTAFYRQLHRRIHTEFRLRKWRAEANSGQKQALRRRLQRGWYWLRLPWDILRLNLLAMIPHRGPEPLKPGLSPEAAAVPSPQND